MNHRRLGVQFAVHFLPMPCYRWLAVGGGVHFCRVRTAPKSPLYAHHLRCVLACGVGVGFLSNGVTWRYGAMGGRGGVFNEVLTNISIFWGLFRLKPLIILDLR